MGNKRLLTGCNGIARIKRSVVTSVTEKDTMTLVVSTQCKRSSSSGPHIAQKSVLHKNKVARKKAVVHSMTIVTIMIDTSSKTRPRKMRP